MQPQNQIPRLILIAILITLAASPLVAYVTFSSTERLVTTWEMTSFRGISIKSTAIIQPGQYRADYR
jgi:hypothetical protein